MHPHSHPTPAPSAPRLSDLAEWATLEEAAAFARLDPDTFAVRAPQLGIVPVAWMGVRLYRRADITASIEAAWRANIDAARRGPSRGSKAASNGAEGTRSRRA